MTELLTAAQMRAVEAAAIASGEVTGLELMERAGQGVVEAIFEEWPELAKTSHRAVVLCGPGGNGGDGFVVARLLKDWGWEVEVFLYGTPERMPPDARVNYERWVRMGEVEVLDDTSLEDTGAEKLVTRIELGPDTLVVDAIFGSGLTRPVSQGLCNLFQWIDMALLYPLRHKFYLVSVDVPSGLCSDSGIKLDKGPERFSDYNAFRAQLTITFDSRKIGHYLEEGPFQSGKINLVQLPLGRRRRIYDDRVLLTSMANARGFWPLGNLNKDQSDHKYAHGHALILSGPSGHGGAARLAARGALRIGAGVVTVACTPDAVAENAARLDAIMLREVADGAGLVEVLADHRINALCLGPGLGLDARAVGLVAVALGAQNPVPGLTRDLSTGGGAVEQGGPGSSPGRAPGPVPGQAVVLDADALTILSHHPDLFAALHPNCILTPHAGEFARLFPDIAAKLAAPATKGPAYSKVDATREAAKRAGCVVLYKGPDTVIADPDGRCSINSAHYDRAAPWLATAGSGDVLAGFITGLLARGFQPMQAAETAAWLHVECALSFGPGLIAEDLPEELPKVFRGLGL